MATRKSSLILFLFWFAANCCASAISSRRSVIRTYAALGDSYAAGAGAGHLIFTPGWGYGCGHWSDAYPIQIANDSRLGVDQFRNLACGGATSSTVLHDQVPHIADSDIVSITVSGNEVEFFVVLNECVYHWWTSSSCEAKLVEARRRIESHVLWDNFQALVRGTLDRMKPRALLLLTGYARFFNAETNICDHVTFSRTRPLDYLIKEKRRALNQLVDMLNDVIRATAEAYGAVYVDIDTAYEGHRFCEDGVQEPDLGRDETWFFNLPPTETDEVLMQQALQIGIWNQHGSSSGVSNSDFLNVERWRVFHPTSLGHRGIAEVLVDEVVARTATSV
ncbi:uncharacterized protein PV06_02386 [Exophiala oligosperma]|uniref:SGNH hydrolase-type esterase domain-containing protein n=2 Tax=Chaetothyriales TaxID=34395 RepID=A0A0D2DVU1_9EURO|nr:uncharacterized protein PV06_02386 [Exophiala oligosperma]KAJ9640646.1 hypothetical protein H2204_003275 [Knufia peltigerae]KIW46740.1 hypothetical protein PV06_02386 [Exophiala oligosperma]